MPEYELTDDESFNLLRKRIEKQLDKLNVKKNKLDEGYLRSRADSHPNSLEYAHGDVEKARDHVERIQEAADLLEELIEAQAEEAEQILEDISSETMED